MRAGVLMGCRYPPSTVRDRALYQPLGLVKSDCLYQTIVIAVLCQDRLSSECGTKSLQNSFDSAGPSRRYRLALLSGL